MYLPIQKKKEKAQLSLRFVSLCLLKYFPEKIEMFSPLIHIGCRLELLSHVECRALQCVMFLKSILNVSQEKYLGTNKVINDEIRPH